MRLLNEKLIDDEDASADINSAPGLLASVFGYSIQITIDGTPAGTVKLQGSDDPVPDSQFNVKNYPVSNWTDIKNSSQAVTGAGYVVYNVADVAYNWVRVVYSASSGTGNMTALLNTKGF